MLGSLHLCLCLMAIILISFNQMEMEVISKLIKSVEGEDEKVGLK